MQEQVFSLDPNMEMQWLAEIVRSSGDAIIGMDMESKIVSWNKGAADLYGYQPEEMVGKSIRSITPKDRMEELQQIFDKLRSGQNIEHYDTVRKTRTGKRIPISITWSLIKNSAGESIGVGAIHKNIQKLKEAELRLSSAQKEIERLLWVVSKTDNSMVIASADGNIEWVNEGFEKLTGFNAEEVIGTTGNAVLMGELSGLDPRSEHYRELLTSEDSVSYESLNFHKKGKKYWVLTTLTAIRNDEGKLINIVAIDSDITSRKDVEHKLLRQKEKAVKLAKVKEQFLANMSHEIRTPMNAILGLTEILEDTRLNVEQKQYVDSLGMVGHSLLNIINDILDLSKLEAGKMEFKKEEFALHSEVNSVVEMIRFQLPPHLELKFNTEVENDLKVLGDRHKLCQVLINVMNNAVKFTEKGGVSVSLSSETVGNDQWATIEVKDTGIGIEATEIRKIFSPFSQLKKDGQIKNVGTGLGLAIVKKILDGFGGTIEVTSKVGTGTTFKIRIPFQLIRNSAQFPKKESTSDLITLSGTNVLLVEDNEINRLIACKFLEKAGVIVTEAVDGLNAVELLTQGFRPDAILMDIQMPNMDGITATSEILKLTNTKEVPIIAMTAHAFESEQEKCRRVGMKGFLVKPLRSEELLNGIQKAIHG